MKTCLIALSLTTAFSLTRAEDAPAPAIVLKHPSTFQAATQRNPFWPIGWVKPAAIDSDATSEAPALTPGSFALTSIATGAGTRFAILNGKVMEEGQQFGLQMGSQLYQVTVQAIEDGQVVLVYQGGQVVVPLRRH